MINKIETGKRITSLRNMLGYSQAAFAEKLGVSPQAVSKWETGQTLPDVELLLTISWMCRVTINEILDSEEVFIDHNIGRELIRMNKFLICPECKKNLSLRIQTSGGLQYFECENNHRFNVEEGVIYFNTREITGELWSLFLRTYEHYLEVVSRQDNLPRYSEGDIYYKEAMWREVEKIRPSTIVDVACGMGSGISYIIERVNWPCTIIMADLSFRVLAWNRKYFTEEMKNPFIDYVCLACDCANMPLEDNSVDLVFSNGGFESMQDKKMAGFKETYRILKPGGHAVYNMSLVDDFESENTKKWIDLYLSLAKTAGWDYRIFSKEQLNDYSQWLAECEKAGFKKNTSVKIYGEMPAPDTDVFPFENQIARWMASHVFVSQK